MAPSYGIALARHLSQDPGAHLNDTSTFGATDGYEGHHEFGYFWRRWFHYTTSHHIDQSRWGDIDVNEMRHVLKRMEATWERPLIFKNPPALSMQVHFFDTHLNDPLFIYVTRSDQDVAFSLRRAREQVLKSPDKWFSTKPPNYEELRALPQVRQIAAQVVFTRREIERQLSCVDQDRIHILQYETLLRTPLAAMENVIDWLSFHIPHLERRSVDISKLVPISPSSRAIDETTRQQLTEALDALS